MDASILIVSKNRKTDLAKTLQIISGYIDKRKHEILVLLDNCNDGSEALISEFQDVFWLNSNERLGASRARNILYKKAKGKILFGFDDDAHPLQRNFIEITQRLFDSNSNVGLIAFKEIRGVFDSDNLIPKKFLAEEPDILVNDFVGCGFAVKKKVYERTRGFPEWIDIYGEEVCVAIEILDKGKDILYTHQVQVNHRVDRTMRNKTGAGYFRFGKQLKNTAWFYFVYYPFPLLLKKIGKLYLHNLKKYGIKDTRFFAEYCKAFMTNLFYFGMIMKYRLPVKKRTLKKFNQLSKPKY